MKYSEFCRFQEGYVNPSQKVPEYFGGQVKWLRATDLNNGSVYTTTSTLSEKGFKSAGKSALLFKPGSIAISKSGTIGRLGILKDYMCGNRAVINIEVDENLMNNMYVFYSLLHKQEEIKELAVGSVQKNLYVSALQGMDIDYKPLKGQNAIAHILSTHDEKIEVNNQINKTLEAMAQALFKQWFIDFEFPNENGEPYKSSGGEMAESELGLIPKGWSVGTISDFVSINPESYSEKEHWEFVEYLDTGNITKNVVDEMQTIDLKNDILPSRAKRKVANDDIVFSTVRPNQLHYGLIKEPNVNTLVSTGFAVLRSQGVFSSEHIFLYLIQDSVIEYLQALGEVSTSTYPAIKPSDIGSLKIAKPLDGITQKASLFFQSTYNQIHVRNEENKELSQLRDILLPKLMSGEIRVPM